MNDDARTPLNHGRQQGAIQSHGREEILVQGLLPDLVRHGDKSAARRRGGFMEFNEAGEGQGVRGAGRSDWRRLASGTSNRPRRCGG